MNFSVIIPVRNGADTLALCLEALNKIRGDKTEIIVVDDLSQVASVEIAEGLNIRVISLTTGHGSATAKNIGAKEATGEILLFVDADVVVPKNTFDLILQTFRQNPAIAAITANVSLEIPFKGFFTQYKNCYMHFVLSRASSQADFFYGSLIAIRRKEFMLFNEKTRVEDTELGQRLHKQGKSIYLDHQLQITHLKQYSLISALKNDFFVPFWWSRTYLLHSRIKDVIRKKTFAHARLTQLFSILAVFLTCLFFVLTMEQLGSLFLLAFVICNARFFGFILRQRGFVFFLKALVWTFIDQIAMGFGVMAGMIYFKVRK